MTTHAFIDGRLVVNSVNLSVHNTGFTLPVEFDELDDSAMGDVGRSRIAGVQDSNLAASWNQDFAAAAVDATLWAALGTVVVVLQPKQGDSPYNPKLALQGGASY